MKNTKSILVVAALAMSTASFAQLPKAIASTSTQSTEVAADSSVILLDKALSASTSGNNAATALALKSSVESIEKSTANSTGDFKDKLLSQVGNLKKLIPLAQSGALNGGVLQKAIALVKMAMGANQLSSILGGKSSLLSSAAGLTSNLGLMKGGLSLLGGDSAKTGGSLINTAMSSVGMLSKVGASAEPAAKKSIGGVLDFAKGLL